MKVTRKVDTVIIEVDIHDAERMAFVLGQTIDLTDIHQESFEPLMKKMRKVGVRTFNTGLFKLGSKNGFPTIERA